MVTHPRDQDGPRASALAYHLGNAFLRATGWRVSGWLPPDSKAVLIAAPHTSGWDLPYMLAVAGVFGVKLNWLGKHTLFRGPAGALLRWLGGIPVDRRAAHGVVRQIVERFARTERMVLAIAPAGTRSGGDGWKSGFYHMAMGAKVPIVCGFLDYRQKVGGVGPAIVPTGDVPADMSRIRAFYADIVGRHRDRRRDVVLREELQLASAASAG